MQNNIVINSNNLKIDEKQKITTHWLKFMFTILGLQSILYWNTYLKSRENYDLIIAVFITIIVITFFTREYFFRTNKNSIDLNEIRKVSIRKVAFEKEKVYLIIRLKTKTREILISKDQAIEIKREIEDFLQSTAANNGYHK